MSGSGKSQFIIRNLIPAWRAQGRLPLVFDVVSPTLDRWPGAAWVTRDGQAFIQRARRSKNCLLIVDEVRNLRLDWQCERASIWLATEARNFGHKSIFAGQFATHANPSVRGNCSTLWAFVQPPRDAKLLAADWNCAELLETLPLLPSGVCMRLKLGEKPVKVRTYINGANSHVKDCIDI